MHNALTRCPYEPYCSRAPQFSYVRLLHAVPNAPAVDVYANNKVIARNLRYGSFTEYLPFLPGVYNIKIFPAGQKVNPVLNADINIAPNLIGTIAVTGELPNISTMLLSEPPLQIQPNRVYIRAAHLSPNAPAVDVTLPDGKLLFSNVKFREVTNYIDINPGTYTLQLRIAGTNQVVLTVPNASFKAGRIYTVYAVGLAGKNPPLQALLPLDGSSYINLAR